MDQLFFFTEVGRANSYGIGTYVEQMVKCFSGFDKINVYIIYLRSKEKEFIIKKENNITYIYIPNEYTNFLSKKSTYYRNVFYLLLPYIDKEMKSIFHFNYFQQINLVPFIKEAFPRSLICFTVHYFSWCFIINSNLLYFNQIINTKESLLRNDVEREVFNCYKLDKYFLDSIDYIICLSKFTEKLLINEYKIPTEKIHRINNGLDNNRAVKINNRLIQKQKLYIKPTDKVILFVGRLDFTKGIDLLVESFKAVLKKYNDVILLIVGDGNYSWCINKCSEISSKVMFLGKLDKITLSNIYNIADIGVMPSRHEQCSFVAIEMMMNGLSVISSNTSGLNEMFSDISKLNFVEKESQLSVSTKELTRLILRHLNDDNFRFEIGKDNYCRYIDKYTFKTMKVNYLLFYQGIFNADLQLID